MMECSPTVDNVTQIRSKFYALIRLHLDTSKSCSTQRWRCNCVGINQIGMLFVKNSRLIKLLVDI